MPRPTLATAPRAAAAAAVVVGGGEEEELEDTALVELGATALVEELETTAEAEHLAVVGWTQRSNRSRPRTKTRCKWGAKGLLRALRINIG